MNRISTHRLNQPFLLWLLLANGFLLTTAAPTALDYWLGSAWVWALLIPGVCLVWLNPRRSWGVVLAFAGTLLWLVWRTGQGLRSGSWLSDRVPFH